MKAQRTKKRPMSYRPIAKRTSEPQRLVELFANSPLVNTRITFDRRPDHSRDIKL